MPTRGDRRGLLRRAVLVRGALPYSLARYTVAQLPAASQWTGAHVYVSDDIDGGVESFSDGTYWRRVTDLAIVRSVTPALLVAAGAAVVTLNGVSGPYFVSRGTAVGTLSAACFSGGSLSAAGAAVATLGAPPFSTGAASGTGAAAGTMAAAARLAAALSASGAGVGTLVGVAA